MVRFLSYFLWKFCGDISGSCLTPAFCLFLSYPHCILFLPRVLWKLFTYIDNIMISQFLFYLFVYLLISLLLFFLCGMRIYCLLCAWYSRQGLQRGKWFIFLNFREFAVYLELLLLLDLVSFCDIAFLFVFSDYLPFRCLSLVICFFLLYPFYCSLWKLFILSISCMQSTILDLQKWIRDDNCKGLYKP